MENNLTEEECSGCVNFHEIHKLKDVDIKTISNDYLYVNLPYVVVDANKNWPKDGSGELLFSLDRLNEVSKIAFFMFL